MNDLSLAQSPSLNTKAVGDHLQSEPARPKHFDERTPSESEPSDLECVQRTCDGDLNAFSLLVERHEAMVYNLAYRFMRNATSAEDMAQEAFVKAFRLLKGFRGECSFATWLYSVTRSVCLTEIGKGKRRGEVELTPSHEAEMSVSPATFSDMPDLIRRCVAKLPKRYATVISLYYLEETPYEEIARSLQIPNGTLKTWMYRARSELRKLVESEMNACTQE